MKKSHCFDLFPISYKFSETNSDCSFLLKSLIKISSFLIGPSVMEQSEGRMDTVASRCNLGFYVVLPDYFF